MKKEFNKEVVLNKVHEVSNNVVGISAGAAVVGLVVKCKPVQVAGVAVTFASVMASKITGKMAGKQMSDDFFDLDCEDEDDDSFEENYLSYEDGEVDILEATEHICGDDEEYLDDEDYLLAKISDADLVKMTMEEIDNNAKSIDPDSTK